MKKQIYLLTIVILLLMGCKSANEPEIDSENADALMPLKKGNYWLYKKHLLNDSTGSIKSTDSQINGYIVDTLYSLSNQKYYQLKRCYSNFQLMDHPDDKYRKFIVGYNNENGFYFGGIVKNKKIAQRFDELIFNKNPKKGDKLRGHLFYINNSGNELYYSTYYYYDTLNVDYICESVDSLFETEIGSYKTIVYSSIYLRALYSPDGENWEPWYDEKVTYFIKKGIGIVGKIITIYNYYTKRNYYLEKYSLYKYGNK